MVETVEETVKLSKGSLQSQAACPERYEIKSLIGHGGMGFVFHATDNYLLRDVAIKVLVQEGSRDPDSQQRFLREAQALALLVHQNIVRIYSSDLNSQGNPYHVMEYLEGEPLSRELARGPLKAEHFFSVFRQLLAGLHYAHSQGIVHRDLKPSNIMRCDGEAEELYKIIDFGIARMDMSADRATSSLTRTDAVMGSPKYISPEQCRGERGDYLSDVYSIGCIMHECISGKALFEGETAFETMYKQMTEPPKSLYSERMSEESKHLGELINKCLQKDPARRPKTASEIALELDKISSLGLENLDIFSKQSSKSKSKIRTKSATLRGALASLMIVGLMVWLHQSRVSTAFLTSIVKSELFKSQRDINKLKLLIASCKSPTTIKKLCLTTKICKLAIGSGQCADAFKKQARQARI